MSEENKNKLNMELRSEAAQKEFNTLAENAAGAESANCGHRTDGSNQVRNEKAAPELNMRGEAGAEANRQRHQAEMQADSQAAQERSSRARELIEAAKLQRDFNAAAQGNQRHKDNDLER